MSSEQKQKLLKAKVAVALQHASGKVPTTQVIEHVALLALVLYPSVLGTHFKRREQQAAGQLAIFYAC